VRGELFTLHLPWQAPTAVSQFTTQAVKASLSGLVDGRVKAGAGTVTVCWARAPSALTVRKLRKQRASLTRKAGLPITE